MKIKTEIEKNLNPLIGLQLTRTTRAANMECLKFGLKEQESIKSRIVNVGEYGLHIQCDWRIIKENEIIVGSRDLFEPSTTIQDSHEFDYEKGNLRDKKIRNLINKNRLIVKSIISDNFGGLKIEFLNNYLIEIIPMTTTEDEYWRLLNNKNEKEKHFIISGNGIE